MKLALFMLMILFQLTTLAQGAKRPAPKPTGKPLVVKGKPPTITATIAGMQSGTYTASAAKMMIDSSLVLKDENGKKYPIFRCSFMYKKKMVYKNEESGENQVTWEYLESVLKNNTQLDANWRSTIKEDLKTGEEISFENILADSQKGYMIQVKAITIKIK